MIEFVDIVSRLQYPPKIRATLMRYHSDVVEYVMAHYQGTHKFRLKVVNCINSLSVHVLRNDYVDWPLADPVNQVDGVDDATCKSELGSLYLAAKDVRWSDLIESRESADIPSAAPTPSPASVPKPPAFSRPSVPVRSIEDTRGTMTDVPTPKSALYLQPPVVPQFSATKIWMSGNVAGSRMVIYTTLPEIPTCQNEISVTTDLNRMTDRDLLRLYPNRRMPTRGAALYAPTPGLEMDPALGVLFPISGFTEEQIRDNIIRYPHFYHLSRLVDGELVSFYNTIEIDGELQSTLDVWDSLPDAKVIPRQAEFIRDYVIRRYLLERDILHVRHKYPLYGALDPFLTLFMPADDYIAEGYTDTLEIVKQCVRSRVAFKQTRNPVIRRLRNG